MEFFTTVVSIAFLLALLLVPIVIFIRVRKRTSGIWSILIYLVSALIVTAVITLGFAWWAHYSNEILMSHYGYDFEAMEEGEGLRNVKREDIDRVRQLKLSRSGLGWPLKAIMMYEFCSAYLIIVYVSGELLRTILRNNINGKKLKKHSNS